MRLGRRRAAVIRGPVLSSGSAAGSATSLVACRSALTAGVTRLPGADDACVVTTGAGRTVPVAPDTASVAVPPSELVTRTVPGLATLVNWPLYVPPLFCSVPMTAPVPSFSARSVALEFELVASTRSARLAESYCARVTRTVSAFGGGGGGWTTAGFAVMSFDSDCAPPGTATVIVVVCGAVTVFVVTGKVAVVAPAGTTTVAGTVATAVLELDRSYVAPPGGAVLSMVTVPWNAVPPVTFVLRATETSGTGGWAVTGSSVMCPVTLVAGEPGCEALTSTPVWAGTVVVVAVKVMLVEPAGTVTVAGTLTCAGSLLVRLTVKPPLGAGPLTWNVPVVGRPPVTLLGPKDRDSIVTGSGGCV